jgi:hypothetical protein
MSDHDNGDSARPTTVPGDDETLARAMLDDLLAGRPQQVLRQGDHLFLSTSRGVERIDLPAMSTHPRVRFEAPLLGLALAPAGLFALEDGGRLSRRTRGTTFERVIEAGGPTRGCHLLAAHPRGLLLARGTQAELRDADDGSLLARSEPVADGPVTALAAGQADTVMVGRAGRIDVLALRGRELQPAYGCDLGEGDVLALASTCAEPGDDDVVVAFDEFGWLHVLAPTESGALATRGRIDLELDGGVPERAGLACDGPAVIVASGTRLLHLVDLRAPHGRRDPVTMATSSVGLGLTDVVVDEDAVYLADALFGLVVVDRALLSICHDDPVRDRVRLVRDTNYT